jgi:hypothetical protein
LLGWGSWKENDEKKGEEGRNFVARPRSLPVLWDAELNAEQLHEGDERDDAVRAGQRLERDVLENERERGGEGIG